MRLCSWNLCKCLTQIERVAGGKAVGRWHDGMLSWDDLIPSRDVALQNRGVGLITLKDTAGCG